MENKQQDEKKTVKFILLGDFQVGKTSISMEYFNPKSSKNGNLTETHPTFEKNLQIKEKSILLSIQDLNMLDNDTYSNLENLFQNVHFFILCFSVNDSSSLEKLKKFYVPEIEKYSSNSYRILVGTKSDSKNDKSISDKEVKVFSKESGCFEYIETSAHLRSNIDEIFEHCVGKLISKENKKDCILS